MHHLRDGIDMALYMKLYTAVHDFCTSARGISQSTTTLTSTAQRGGKLRQLLSTWRLFLLVHFANVLLQHIYLAKSSTTTSLDI